MSERDAPRRIEIDLIRVIAMIGVFAAHTAEPFNPWDSWHIQAPERPRPFGELVLFLAPWVIPLFFVVAGMSAWHSLAKRSAREYLHERATRLIIPLAVGIVLIVPPQVYYDHVQHGRFDGSYIAFYPRFFDGVYPSGNFTWAHLWFLAALGVVAVITLPAFRWLRTPRGRTTMSRLGAMCDRPGAILLLALPLIAVRALSWWLFPDARRVVLDWSNRATLLPVFVYGYMLAGEPRLMHAVDRQWKLMMAVAVAFSIAMYAWAWPGVFIERLPAPYSRAYVLVWSAYALGGWAWCVAVLGAVRAWRRQPGALLDRATWLLNPFYMLHQTFIVAFAFYLASVGGNPLATYALLFVSAFAATTVFALLATRWRVSRFLLGVRSALPPGALPHSALSRSPEVFSHDRNVLPANRARRPHPWNRARGIR